MRKKIRRTFSFFLILMMVSANTVSAEIVGVKNKFITASPKNPVIMVKKRNIYVGEKENVRIMKSRYYTVKSISYHTSCKSTISINKKGKLTGRKTGKAYITVSCVCVKNGKEKKFRKKLKIRVMDKKRIQKTRNNAKSTKEKNSTQSTSEICPNTLIYPMIPERIANNQQSTQKMHFTATTAEIRHDSTERDTTIHFSATTEITVSEQTTKAQTTEISTTEKQSTTSAYLPAATTELPVTTEEIPLTTTEITDLTTKEVVTTEQMTTENSTEHTLTTVYSPTTESYTWCSIYNPTTEQSAATEKTTAIQSGTTTEFPVTTAGPPTPTEASVTTEKIAITTTEIPITTEHKFTTQVPPVTMGPVLPTEHPAVTTREQTLTTEETLISKKPATTRQPHTAATSTTEQTTESFQVTELITTTTTEYSTTVCFPHPDTQTDAPATTESLPATGNAVPVITTADVLNTTELPESTSSGSITTEDISSTTTATTESLSEKSIKKFDYLSQEQKISCGEISALTDYDYKILEQYSIPGVNETVKDDIQNQYVSCDNLVPQGFCFTQNYLLVSEYCSATGHDQHNSIIAVLDRSSGQLVNIVDLGGSYHVGGLATDGNYIFTCDSAHKSLLGCTVSRLESVLNGQQTTVSVPLQHYYVGVTTSSVTYNKTDGLFYISEFYYPSGKHNLVGEKGYFYAFSFDGTAFLKKTVYTIPNRTQGLCFSDDGTKLYLSRSYVRKTDSGNYLSQIEEYSFSGHKNSYLVPEAVVVVPPMLEQINYVSGEICMLFESDGIVYAQGLDGKGTSVSPIDKLIQFLKKTRDNILP